MGARWSSSVAAILNQGCLAVLTDGYINNLGMPYTPYSIQHSTSWRGNRFSASQKIPRILWNPKVLYGVYRCLPPIPILSQIKLVLAHPPPTTHFLTININIINPSMLGSSKLSLSHRFPDQTLYESLLSPHTCYMFRPSYSSPFGHPNNIWWGVQIMKL